MCSPDTQDSPVIVGVEEIAAYLRRSRRVVRRMIHSGELPVALKHGAYMTSKQMLDDWLKKEAAPNGDQMT